MKILKKLLRAPDFIIGQKDDPYLLRWWIIPRNRFFNIYLHKILRSDDDRALHDHPWWNVSILLSGGYWEHTPKAMKWRGAGSIIFRRAKAAHRLELEEIPCEYHGGAAATEEQAVDCEYYQIQPCWSLFITGPRIREWGFYCPKGWRHWKDFTNPDDNGATIGRGCE